MISSLQLFQVLINSCTILPSVATVARLTHVPSVNSVPGSPLKLASTAPAQPVTLDMMEEPVLAEYVCVFVFHLFLTFKPGQLRTLLH